MSLVKLGETDSAASAGRSARATRAEPAQTGSTPKAKRRGGVTRFCLGRAEHLSQKILDASG